MRKYDVIWEEVFKMSVTVEANDRDGAIDAAANTSVDSCEHIKDGLMDDEAIVTEVKGESNGNSI
jgi:hypothetical protein